MPLIKALRRRYAGNPDWLKTICVEALIGLILIVRFPVTLRDYFQGRRLQRCDKGLHSYRVQRVDYTLEPIEWRCRTCGQWQWRSPDGEVRHTRPPWVH